MLLAPCSFASRSSRMVFCGVASRRELKPGALIAAMTGVEGALRGRAALRVDLGGSPDADVLSPWKLESILKVPSLS